MTALVWHKSSHSGDANCVEVAWTAVMTGLRDSKCPTAGHIAVRATAFRAFVRSLKDN